LGQIQSEGIVSQETGDRFCQGLSLIAWLLVANLLKPSALGSTWPNSIFK
jgi:hypothetical protein